MRKRKPKVIVDCVANHYTDNEERIVEYTFGGDSRGNAIGGLICLRWIQNRPTVQLYCHSSQVEITVGKAEEPLYSQERDQNG